MKIIQESYSLLATNKQHQTVVVSPSGYQNSTYYFSIDNFFKHLCTKKQTFYLKQEFCSSYEVVCFPISPEMVKENWYLLALDHKKIRRYIYYLPCATGATLQKA